MYKKLTRPEDYRTVYRAGSLKFGKYVAVHVLEEGEAPTIVGISVSKKVGKAVTRNKVKRRLREVVRQLYQDILPGYQIVIGAKAKSQNASFLELRDDFCRVMKGLGLLKKK